MIIFHRHLKGSTTLKAEKFLDKLHCDLSEMLQ